MSDRLDDLKLEATELGIKFNPQIGEEKLQEKIDAYYKSQETSGVEIISEVDEGEEITTDAKKPVVKGEKTMSMIAKEIYDVAKVTKIVTIIDNDQRVNNQTTTCQANWSNQFYDMGTKRFPLNVPIEIPQGFIDVLKEVKIPHHVKDSNTGLNRMTMRPRYSIQVEDVKK